MIKSICENSKANQKLIKGHKETTLPVVEDWDDLLVDEYYGVEEVSYDQWDY